MLRILVLLLFVPLTVFAQQAMPPANVVTAIVKEAEINPTGKMVGVLLFDHMSEVASEEEGIIEEVFFDTGLVVKKGDVLVELNTELLGKDISIVRAQIGEADAEMNKLSSELKRLESLKKRSLASQSAYDNIYYDLKAQKNRKTTLMRQFERSQLKLEKSKIRAPFDAIVLEKKKDRGDWLGHGDVLARLGSTSGVRAIIPVAERLMQYQTPGQEFDVFLPGIQKSIRGKFSGWVPFAELRTKSVYMKIVLPYEKGMVENMSTEIEVATAQPRTLLLVPRAALSQKQGAANVYTIKDGKAVIANVNIISRVGDYVGVESHDLKAGMPVVIDGNDRLKPQQPVNIIKQ